MKITDNTYNAKIKIDTMKIFPPDSDNTGNPRKENREEIRKRINQRYKDAWDTLANR